jgi:hypothetical protein
MAYNDANSCCLSSGCWSAIRNNSTNGSWSPESTRATTTTTTSSIGRRGRCIILGTAFTNVRCWQQCLEKDDNHCNQCRKKSSYSCNDIGRVNHPSVLYICHAIVVFSYLISFWCLQVG